MANEWHIECFREGVDRWNRRRRRVRIAPDLSGIRFFDLLPPDFRDSPKTSRFFERIDLSGANLAGSDLSDLNFTRANFKGANLANANLSKSNFSYANFEHANLTGAFAERAQFSGALFLEAQIGNLTLVGVEAQNVVFAGTALSETQRAALVGSRVLYFPLRSNFNDYVKSQKVSGPFRDISSSQSRTSAETTESALGFQVNPEPFSPSKSQPVQKHRYNVFYGTNRGKRIERGVVVGYNEKRENSMKYGICEVIVPPGHKIGSLGTPWWRNLRGKADDKLSIENLVTLDEEEFWRKMVEVSRRMKEPERPTIFIHGFNVSFEEAVLRAAQIGYDLGIGKGIGLFSWPSKGRFYSYKTDEASVDHSKYFLADFIERFIDAADGGEINVIAHSMGCRCLMGAIEKLAAGRTKVLRKINQIILAAADVDAGQMPMIAPHAVSNARRTTSYISDRDKALKVSGWMHSFPRVGVMPPPFVFSGMDTILVNNLALGGFSHGYLGSSRTVLHDIFDLLNSDAHPLVRFSIESVSMHGATFWKLRE